MPSARSASSPAIGPIGTDALLRACPRLVTVGAIRGDIEHDGGLEGDARWSDVPRSGMTCCMRCQKHIIYGLRTFQGGISHPGSSLCCQGVSSAAYAGPGRYTGGRCLCFRPLQAVHRPTVVRAVQTTRLQQDAEGVSRHAWAELQAVDVTPSVHGAVFGG